MNDNNLARNTVLVGDAVTRLGELAAASVDCVVTSPPYFNLRDYGHAEQLGAESVVGEWVEAIRGVAGLVARVLRPHGTFWLNVGDGYSPHARYGAPKKGLLLAPQRLVVALAEDGWIVRNQIVWHKPNGLPSSVRDRLSNTYEVVYLLARAERYWFDLDAIRVPAVSRRSHGGRRRRSRGRKGLPPVSGALITKFDDNRGLDAMNAHGVNAHPLGKSPGDVWSIATANYSGAHFATYPIPLAERMVLAGCPEKVCTVCRTPWRRALRRTDSHSGERLLRTGALRPDCTCGAASTPGLVLDPFMGTGTTAIAAEIHRRDWLGIELNADYAAMASERIETARRSPQGETR